MVHSRMRNNDDNRKGGRTQERMQQSCTCGIVCDVRGVMRHQLARKQGVRSGPRSLGSTSAYAKVVGLLRCILVVDMLGETTKKSPLDKRHKPLKRVSDGNSRHAGWDREVWAELLVKWVKANEETGHSCQRVLEHNID